AYKATTVRVARSFAAGAQPPSWSEAERWVQGAAGGGLPTSPPGRIVARGVDASVGTAPLESVDPSTLPKGALAVVSTTLELADGPWLGAVPVLLGERALA